jgi:uncharacterized membrane protein
MHFMAICQQCAPVVFSGRCVFPVLAAKQRRPAITITGAVPPVVVSDFSKAFSQSFMRLSIMAFLFETGVSACFFRLVCAIIPLWTPPFTTK